MPKSGGTIKSKKHQKFNFQSYFNGFRSYYLSLTRHCFGGPRMVLHAHFKKYIFKLGVWFLMYPRRPPRPPVWSKTTLFPDFFCNLPLFGSLLRSKEGGTRTTFEVFSFLVKNSRTENPEEPLGLAKTGLWTDRLIFLDF